MDDQEILRWKNRLDAMDQKALASLQRFAPTGHPVFVTGSELYAYFRVLFKGMTPELSKAIGWED